MEIGNLIAEPVVSKVLDCTVESLVHQISYVFSCTRNLENLESELRELQAARERVKNSVDTAIRNGEDIHQDVLNWLDSVDKCTANATLLLTTHEKEKMDCFLGLCPDIMSRYKLSKEAVEKLNYVTELCGKGKFDQVSFRFPARGMGFNSYLKDYVAFESRLPILDGLVEVLADSEVDTIGLCGMGGVGKTTLVKEAAERAKHLNLFDSVVIATVSWKQDIEKIQGEIADKLGLEFREQSVPGRADRLFDRLMEEKRVLIILDDIWSGLDLEKVGIPYPDTHKGCKLLLISRQNDVLVNYMYAQKIFQVGILPTEEAWALFKKFAGDRVESSDLYPTAKKVAEKCAGLPIAIATVARALKNKGLEEWNNALRELERPFSWNYTGVPDDAYQCIEFSYNQLGSEELKSVFLLCGYMGGSHIMDLVKYGVGLGLFQLVNSMEEVRDKVHSLVRKLEASCLLLSRSAHDQFALHDVVRDVAISIVSRDVQIFVMRENVGPKKFPDTSTLKNCTAITLFDVYIEKLPQEIECPKLQFFHIFNKNPSLEIPVNFFRGMPEVRVIDLTGMLLLSLPTSLLRLRNLRTLCLDHSILGDISGIGKLKTLEVLSFKWSEIELLPKEIGELTSLKLLDLNHCSKLKVIPRGVISRLSQLEELYMNNSFNNWELEGATGNGSRNATLAELKHLPNLTAFDAHIQDAQLIPKGLLTGKLVRYHISIGDAWSWSNKYETSRTLKLKHSTIHSLDDGVLILLKKAEDLYLDALKGVENVLSRLDGKGFPQLKHLHVRNNPEIQYIMDSSVETLSISGSSDVLPILESLYLNNLINLKNICYGKCIATSLREVRTVKVESCGILKNVFSLSLAKGLMQLQKLEVTDCQNVLEIFAADEYEEDDIINGEATDNFALLQLRSLALRNLPALTSFCSTENSASTSHSSTMDRLQLFRGKIELPRLESLKLSSLNIQKIWQGLHHSSSFRKLTRLAIDGCDLIQYALPYSMISRLEQLKQLEVRKCKMMHQIIAGDESCEYEREDLVSFPRLVFLKMVDLQNLTKFYSGDGVEFPSLQHLEIENCHKLKELIHVKPKRADLGTSGELRNANKEGSHSTISESLFNEKIWMPSLKELMLSSMEMTKIWSDELLTSGCSVQNLASLILENCNRLLYLFPSHIAKNLERLTKLELCSCSNIISVVAASGLETEGKKEKMVFSKLHDMKLENLSSLSRFCGGDSVDFPSLRQLVIVNCPDLKSLISESWTANIAINVQPGEMIPEKKVDGQHLFDEKVGLRKLKRLTISWMDNLTKIWHKHLSAGSFYRLKYLKVEQCPKLSSIFPGNMLFQLQKLKEVQILHCVSLQVLFESQGGNTAESGAAATTESTAMEADVRFELPPVTSLELCGLPELQCFLPDRHISHWPLLNKLQLRGCDKLKLVVSGKFKNTKREIHPEVQLDHAIFVNKATFPNLEELSLE